MIVFESNRAGNYEIYYRNVDTFADRRLFTSPLNETSPAPRPGQPGLLYVEYANPERIGSSNLAGRIVLIPDTASVPLERIYLTPDTFTWKMVSIAFWISSLLASRATSK